jgi:hypothetical protein
MWPVGDLQMQLNIMSSISGSYTSTQWGASTAGIIACGDSKLDSMISKRVFKMDLVLLVGGAGFEPATLGV